MCSPLCGCWPFQSLMMSTRFVVVSALGLGCAEKEVGHPYLSPLNVRRRAKGLTLKEHLIEGVKVLVIDLFIVLVEVDHPVSSLPGHFAASLSARTRNFLPD
jgi:hypothetical protein